LVKVGFVGAGIMAMRHIANLRKIPGVEIGAICDPSPAALERARSSVKANTYSDLGKMVRGEELDAAFVCIPISAHGEVEEILAENGVNLFIEKPLPPDPSIIERVVKALDRSRVFSSVGYHWRYSEATERARIAMQGRRVGMVLGYWLTYLPKQVWWSKREQNPAQIYEQTTHLFDLSRFLVGEITEIYSIAEMRCMGDVSEIEDVSTVSLRFEDGAIGNISSTYMIDYKHLKGLSRLLFSGNTVLRKFAWATKNLGLWSTGHDTNSFRIELEIILKNLVLKIRQGSLLTTTAQGQERYVVRTDPYLDESRAFIEALKTGDTTSIRSPYSDAVKTHNVVIAAIRSAQTHQKIMIEDQDKPQSLSTPQD
jgi:predicted dehydrogenase